MQSFNQQQPRLTMITEQLQNVAYPETTFGLTEMQQQQHVAFPQQRQQQGLWKQLDNQVYGQDQFEVVDNVLTKTLKNIQRQQHHQQQKHQMEVQLQLQQQLQQQQQQQLLSMEPTMMIQSGCVAQKGFRIISEELFFNPKSISVCINGRLCQVTGLCRNTKFELVQFKKSYQLPTYVIPGKYTIFFTENGKFVIEFPIVQGMEGIESYVQQQQQIAGLERHQQSEIVDIAEVQGGLIGRQQITTLPGLTTYKKLTTQQEEYFPVSHLNWGPFPESKYLWEQKQQQILTPSGPVSYNKSYGF
jgi:hypothetical protein